MTRWIAKPSLYNNNDMKDFDNPKAAIKYLNSKLTDVEVDPALNYMFSKLSTSPANIEESIDEYMNIRKLFMVNE